MVSGFLILSSAHVLQTHPHKFLIYAEACTEKYIPLNLWGQVNLIGV